MENGGFVISLDFELFWGLGGHTKQYLNSYKKNIENAVKSLNIIRNILQKYGVKLTVGYVGGIGMKDYNNFNAVAPKRPQYARKELASQYLIDNNPQLTAHSDLFFRPDVVQSLANDDNVELASHTFAHYYCLENGQKIEDFEDDIKTVVQHAPKQLKSIIFPRNQVKQEYLVICKKYGFTHYRGILEDALYKTESSQSHFSIRGALRLLDAYIPLSGSKSFNIKKSDTLRNVPGSSFFRPYSRKLRFLERLKVRRICWSMKQAAKNNKIYHLWWHPHNFGIHTDKNIGELENICQYYIKLRKKYGMKSYFMSEL